MKDKIRLINFKNKYEMNSITIKREGVKHQN